MMQMIMIHMTPIIMSHVFALTHYDADDYDPHDTIHEP